jgi:flagellar biosynthesis anti-sigma factor FlgM
MKIYGNKPPETTEVGGSSRRTVRASKEKDTGTGKTGDMVNISGRGKAIEEIAGALSGLPETREDKVMAVSSAIKDGTYEVSPENIASGMLREMM